MATKPFKTIDDFEVGGKRVLVRADLNVPMKDGQVTDLTRLERTLPTILELAGKGAKVVVLAHFGRPSGRVAPEMSLRPVALALAKLVGRPVPFAADCVGPDAAGAIARLADGDVMVLENLRFHAEEEKNDPAFAGRLAELGDIYVNDAFSCAHRAHASTEAIARLLPAAAGRLMEAELVALGRALEAPARPLAALVGGAKVSTKMEVLGHLAQMVDVLIIGGGMANTFLFADGTDIGKSLCEKDMADQARGIRAAAAKRGCRVWLPSDATVAREFKQGAASRAVALDAVPADSMILDIGPRSIAELTETLAACRTLVWNGPLGAFEIPPFDAGTTGVAREAARLTKAGKLLSVAGGGDTVAALARAGVVDEFTYVSTAGGAFLEWLEGRDLPGVAILKARAK